MKDIAMIKLFENDYDYNNEEYYIVKNDKEKIKELQSIIENASSLDNDEREEEYGYESLWELAEVYIQNNLGIVDCDRYDIDLY